MATTDDEDQQPSEETLTRNWDELLQEIRVTQTGVQILTGFLLTVPFSNRFTELTEFQRDVYLAVLAGSVLTTGLVVAPVAMHRVLFRQRRRELLVESANKFAMAGLALLALTISGVVLLVVDVVVGTRAGWLAGGAILLVLTVLWVVVPRVADRVDDTPRNPPPSDDEELTTPARAVSGAPGGAGGRRHRPGRPRPGPDRPARRRAGRASRRRRPRGAGTGARRRRDRPGTPPPRGSGRPTLTSSTLDDFSSRIRSGSNAAASRVRAVVTSSRVVE